MAAFQLILAYLIAGFVCGVAFVLFGVERAVGGHAKVSPGARILLLPGAIVLWPIVLMRWIKPGAGA